MEPSVMRKVFSSMTIAFKDNFTCYQQLLHVGVGFEFSNEFFKYVLNYISGIFFKIVIERKLYEDITINHDTFLIIHVVFNKLRTSCYSIVETGKVEHYLRYRGTQCHCTPEVIAHGKIAGFKSPDDYLFV